MTPQTRNRVTAVMAITLFAVIVFTLANVSPQATTDEFQRRPSSFFTDRSGGRALFLVMKSLLPNIEQWRKPMNFLPLPGRRDHYSTIIVAAPGRALAQSERDHLRRWLNAGGQLLLAHDSGWRTSQQLSENGVEVDDDSDRGKRQTRSYFLAEFAPKLRWGKPPRDGKTAHVIETDTAMGPLKLMWRRSFSSTDELQVVAQAGDQILAVAIPVGKGRVVAIADPAVVTNKALREADNAVWLVTLAASWGNGRVLFDEYHHGFGVKRSPTELTNAFFATPWGWSVLQLAAAGMLFIFGVRRRFGRMEESLAVSRTSPIELAQARAGIFRVADAKPLAVELIMQHIGHRLGQMLGKTIDTKQVDQELSQLKQHRPADETIEKLRGYTGKSRRGEKLTDQEFIDLGRIAGEIFKGRPT